MNNANIWHELQLSEDLSALTSLFTAIKKPQEDVNKIGLVPIIEQFDEGELGAVHWYSGQKLIANNLTKGSRPTATLLHTAVVTRK